MDYLLVPIMIAALCIRVPYSVNSEQLPESNLLTLFQILWTNISKNGKLIIRIDRNNLAIHTIQKQGVVKLCGANGELTLGNDMSVIQANPDKDLFWYHSISLKSPRYKERYERKLSSLKFKSLKNM